MYNVTQKADLHILTVCWTWSQESHAGRSTGRSTATERHFIPSVLTSCMAFYQSQLFHFHFTVEIGSLWTFSVSQYVSLILSSALSQSREQPWPVSNRRPRLRVIDAGVGEVESNTGNRYSSQPWIAKLTVCAHRRESCCVVHAGIIWRVEASELRSTCAPPPKAKDR